MNVVIPHQTAMILRRSLEDVVAEHASPGISEGNIWINQGLAVQERNNLALLDEFWKCWKAQPVDLEKLGQFFAPDVTVRTGWRGEHVVQGRDNVMAMYAQELKRQTEHGETSDFRFPVVVARGSIMFHTWVWIAHSDQKGYHIERPMAASYLITNGMIERWDSYATGIESEPGYAGGQGPDGL